LLLLFASEAGKKKQQKYISGACGPRRTVTL
jgi:hypothetical protein